MRDFQEHFEEEEKVKLLTIKTNKMPETKTVKGANNIFATGNGFSFDKSPDMLVEELKKGPAKKPAKKMKPGLNVILPVIVGEAKRVWRPASRYAAHS